MKNSKKKSTKSVKKPAKVGFFESYNLLATWFGLGKSKIMPGTLGSLMALLIWVLFNHSLIYLSIPPLFCYVFWILLLILLFKSGADAAEIYSKKTKSKDASAIIIDEVVGQLLVLLLTYNFVSKFILDENNIFHLKALFYHLLLSFILFRFFDITKPSVIGLIDKKVKSGYGVMLDDVVSGIVSAAIICLSLIIKTLLAN